MNIYSIKNDKLNFFNRPIYAESINEALSLIQNILMSDADRALTGLKGDLSLWLLGSIDFTTGKIDPISRYDLDGELMNVPVCICSLQEIFDSIPADRLKPALTRDDLDHVLKLIQELTDHCNLRFECFSDELARLDQCKKEVKK